MRRAFTLLELLVVLSIAGLIAALAVPAVTKTLRGASPRSSLSDVRATLSLARAEALKAGRAVEARLSVGEDEIVIAYADHEKRINAFWLDENNEEPLSARAVRFDSMGRANRENMEFLAASDNDARGIIWRLAFDPVSGAVGRPVNTSAAKEDNQ